MSEFIVRAPRPEELDAVGALTVAAYRADGFLEGDGEYEKELADAARRAAEAELLVAVSAGGDLLGSVTVVRPGTAYAEVSREGELEFRMLATAPAARGRGVGEALIRAVVERARQLGARQVVMSSPDAMKAAHRLYARFGFTRLPERDWEPVPSFWIRTFALDLYARSGADPGTR
ncbi:MAG TPA: GNAT family N-acetyltransferase [Amycolatopsis sp.]|uniref:GNAT family N-acetyltransferase n=1 Tax=Amycolatopsis sp. TaxID=37632 RepID=UPI002B45CA47|nr:GNAT family N-acetyltransferase [Amycolatopsis sp.]HKS47203.1 GNAT family N-acetyltransferase [Amycolatopsis sp.]